MTYLEIEELSQDLFNALYVSIKWKDLQEASREIVKKQVRKLLGKYDITPRQSGEKS